MYANRSDFFWLSEATLVLTSRICLNIRSFFFFLVPMEQSNIDFCNGLSSLKRHLVEKREQREGVDVKRGRD